MSNNGGVYVLVDMDHKIKPITNFFYRQLKKPTPGFTVKMLDHF